MAATLLLAACGSSNGDDAVPTGQTAAPATESADAAPSDTSAPSTEQAPVTTELEQPLAINDIQVIGSHNSFHLKPQQTLFDGITAVSAELAESIEYSHRTLTEQLENFGIRQFELDVFADPEGGLYATRAANAVVGLDPVAPEPELQTPGYKVLHTQDFDFETTCLTLVLCLGEIEAWPSANPNHLPVMVMVETPDDVRGDAATLESAVLEQGWPTIEDSRGKVMILLNNQGDIRDLYLDGHPNIESRPMFTSANPGDADAAFVRLDDPNTPGIAEVAAAGYPSVRIWRTVPEHRLLPAE